MEQFETVSVAPKQTEIAGEDGRALPWPIVICLLLSVSYLQFAKEYVEKSTPELFGTIVICILVIANIFALGCSLQLIFLGGESNNYIRKNLKRQSEDLRKLVDTAHECLAAYEADLGKTKIQLSARGIDNLSLLRRITLALESRTSEIESLISRGSKIDLIDADELFRRKLLVEENAVTSIMNSSGGMPPIPPDEWASTITSLISEVMIEQRMTA